jgi:hypothetical protein
MHARYGNRGGSLVACGDVIKTSEQARFPIRERFIDIDIAIDSVGETLGAEGGEFQVEVAAELAEVLVVAVTKGKHCVGEVFIAREMFKAKFLKERLNTIRGISVAISACNEYGILLRRQRRGSIANQR